jgi:hypothetical protein
MGAAMHDATMLPIDYLTAAAVTRAALEPALGLDWQVRAGDLAWNSTIGMAKSPVDEPTTSGRDPGLSLGLLARAQGLFNRLVHHRSEP